MKVLVTGAGGQLGYDVCRVLAQRGIPWVGTDSTDCDITDAEAVEALFQRVRPDAVVHCAAYSQVDQAEAEAERCYAVNVLGTQHITENCKRRGCYLVYISTD